MIQERTFRAQASACALMEKIQNEDSPLPEEIWRTSQRLSPVLGAALHALRACVCFEVSSSPFFG